MAKQPRTINKRPIPFYKVNMNNSWAKKRLLRYLRRGDRLISQKELLRAGYTPARIRQMVKLKVIEAAPPRRLPQKKVPPVSAEPSAKKPMEIPTADLNPVGEQAARRGHTKMAESGSIGTKEIKKGKEI